MHRRGNSRAWVDPTDYPEATVKSTDACSAIVKSDGTTWETVVPYTCNDVAVKLDN